MKGCRRPCRKDNTSSPAADAVTSCWLTWTAPHFFRRKHASSKSWVMKADTSRQINKTSTAYPGCTHPCEVWSCHILFPRFLQQVKKDNNPLYNLCPETPRRKPSPERWDHYLRRLSRNEDEFVGEDVLEEAEEGEELVCGQNGGS